VRLDIRRIANIQASNGNLIGARVRVKVAKNKLAPPFKVAEFDILYGTGISKAGDVLDLGVENKIVDKAGTWYSYGDVRLGQGRENARQYFNENPALMDEVEAKIRTKLGVAAQPLQEDKDKDKDKA
jgi:recombination protein RecA